MFHEEAPDQVVAVAEPLRLARAREQQQARILDASRGEHEAVRANQGAGAIQRGQPEAGHPIRVAIAQQLDGVGVQQDPDVLGSRELGVELRAEARGRARCQIRFTSLLGSSRSIQPPSPSKPAVE